MLPLSYYDVSRWFTLTIDPVTGFPCLVIFSDIFDLLPGPCKPEIIQIYRKQLMLNEESFPFEYRLGEKFGFGNSITRIGVTDKTTTYRLNLPVLRKQTNEPCSNCADKSNSYICYRCYGTKKETYLAWEEAFALSASLGILTNMLWLVQTSDRKTDIQEKQIFTITILTEKGMHGGSLGGHFSPFFINFLKTFEEGCSFDKAVKAMTKVYTYMYGSQNIGFEKHSFRAWQSLPGNLMLDVPGDACGIHPSSCAGEISKDRGIEWSCHNVDSPLQQLTLLTGLAAMCDMAG